MFKCAKISLSKLSLRKEFSFACFKLLESFFSKSDSEKLQHEVLPDNCQLKTFEISFVQQVDREILYYTFLYIYE